jgi:monoterpene epsilon-lactone hydrolase
MALLRQLLVLMVCSVVVLCRRLLRGPRVAGWTRRFEILVAIVRYETRRQSVLAPARVRAQMLRAPIPRSLQGTVVREKTEIAGCPAELLTPTGWTPGSLTVLYLHGGGYVVCSPGTHRDTTARITAASGARLVVLDYRLAPEHPYPAGIEDTVAVWRELASQPGPLAVAGDSAGGGLSLALMLRLRDAGEAMPTSAVLLSPWVDLTCSGSSIDTHTDDYLDRATLERFAAHYLQGTDPTTPEVSPVFADLRGLPPMLLITGGSEVFLDENLRLADCARAAGCEVTVQVGEGMVHAWPAFAAVVPEGRTALGEVGTFLSHHAAPDPDGS